MSLAQQQNSWDALIEQARAGSPEALGKLLEPFRQYLVSAANRKLANDLKAKEGASDLVQQTFFEAVRGFDGFGGETPDDLRKWLLAIFDYRLIDFIRHYRSGKRQINREVPLAGDSSDIIGQVQLAARGDGPRSNAAAQEEALRLELALARLEPSDAQLLRWRNHERLSFPEIGRRMQISADAARKSWARALQRLRSILLHPRAADADSEYNP